MQNKIFFFLKHFVPLGAQVMINLQIEDQSQRDLDIASEFPAKENLQVILRFDLGWKWTLFHTWHITDQLELVWFCYQRNIRKSYWSEKKSINSAVQTCLNNCLNKKKLKKLW